MLIPKIESRISQYLSFLEARRYRQAASLEFETFETGDTLRAPPVSAPWEKIAAPYLYGKPWSCSWFRASFRAPSSSRPLFLRVVPNADSLVFIDGKPRGAFNPFHTKLRIDADGREHTLHLESYTGHYYPGCHSFEGQRVMLTLSRQPPEYPNTFEGGALLERLEPVYALYYDVRALFETARILDKNSLRRARILKGLYEALMAIHFSSEGDILEEEAAEAGRKIAPLLAAKNSPTTPEIYLIGHAHLDHAWLWHIGETERKAARTFMNMVQFTREYPEFVFIQSQPAQLEVIKNEYPDIFAAVKEAYERGGWEPNGGMWVEADCNISGGESLIRQFLVGKGATREMLGYEGDTLWLPDVFGYAAALPQILSGCGIKYFVTSKINWNDTTRFPYDTFIWRGIDGSAVKTHYIASRSQGYNGRVSPESLAEIWGQIQHKELQSGTVKSVGEGDGGGGVSREDLEMARRLGDLEGAPRAAWKKVSEALDRIFSENTEWPEWRGELYLELHRGTYTTQAKTKQYNRGLEFGLRFTEWLAGTAALEGWAPYPRETLLACWKKLLTNQFHDIIPGSSIRRVYAEAEAEYQKIEAALAEINAGLLAKIPPAGKDGVRVFNDLSWERGDPVTVHELPGNVAALKVPEGRAGEPGGTYPVQRYRDFDGRETAAFAPSLPSLGWVSFVPAEPPRQAGAGSPFSYQNRFLKTPFYHVRFDEAGRIAGLIDLKQGRELVAPGGTFNGFISAQDVPVKWEAWDIDADWTKYLTEETRLLGEEIAADGPVCFRIRRNYAIGAASALTQDTVFYAGEGRIDFETKVDWREKRRLLKAGFDTAIDATQIRCEVQYGHLIRNTHRNLPSDRAKFEICAHKWVSLEEAGGGLALLNKTKYGHDAEGGRLRLTLLRSPTAPDEEADQGEQRFTYSLLPFSGPFDESPVIRAAYELNDPARAVPASVADCGPGAGKTPAPAAYSLFTLEGKGIIAESLKAPEDSRPGGKSLMIRLYESLGGRAGAVLRFSRELAAAQVTDMLELNPRALPVSGKELALDFRAFEIKTVVVQFQ
ncbi:MAG: glycosyl hydrolase-related protein [Treponema sp.]|jgi:alpha-mannosidase|nr:glycosyl hydrolase-related protein [Treponema sp.]